MTQLAVGIDLGGSFVKGALVDEGGNILLSREIPTVAQEGSDRVLARIAGLVRELAEQGGARLRDLAGVGVGVPGFLDEASGVAVEVINIGWRDVPVRKILTDELGTVIHLENDANAAALGEVFAGGGRGYDSALFVTLGTGVGGGIVIGGRVHRGVNMMAGEIGHLVLEPGGAPCNCGRFGCLETISSATGLVRLALQYAREAGTPLSGEEPTAEAVFASAARGSSYAQRAVHHAVEALGRGLAMAADLLNPQVIVVGGGMAKAGDALLVP
ncbi:MAG: ROK family protein, partial [Firmicutes bacterium]|nr:ROK family protein [Bacillota bacterium]